MNPSRFAGLAKSLAADAALLPRNKIVYESADMKPAAKSHILSAQPCRKITRDEGRIGHPIYAHPFRTRPMVIQIILQRHKIRGVVGRKVPNTCANAKSCPDSVDPKVDGVEVHGHDLAIRESSYLPVAAHMYGVLPDRYRSARQFSEHESPISLCCIISPGKNGPPLYSSSH